MGNEVSGATYLCANAVTKGHRCVFFMLRHFFQKLHMSHEKGTVIIQDEKIQDHSFHFEEGHLGAILSLSLIFQAAGRAKRNK